MKYLSQEWRWDKLLPTTNAVMLRSEGRGTVDCAIQKRENLQLFAQYGKYPQTIYIAIIIVNTYTMHHWCLTFLGYWTDIRCCLYTASPRMDACCRVIHSITKKWKVPVWYFWRISKSILIVVNHKMMDVHICYPKMTNYFSR